MNGQRKKYRIECKDASESSYIQNVLFNNGYMWQSGDKLVREVLYLYIDATDQTIALTYDPVKFNSSRSWTLINRQFFDAMFAEYLKAISCNKPKTQFEGVW